MGLYDNVEIPVELLKAQPDERIQKYASLIKGETADFQTKNLDCAMLEFKLKKVDDEYRLFKVNITGKFLPNEDKKSIFSVYFEEESRTEVAQDITATFCAFDFFDSDTLDIVIDLKIKVIAGVFVSMECVEYEERDPGPRLKQMKDTMQRLKECSAYYKTFRGRAALLVRKILLSLHKRIYKFNNWLQKLSFKL